MDNRQERQKKIDAIMEERGCGNRQARKVLQLTERGGAIPSMGFGPDLIGEEGATDSVLAEYVKGKINADEARRRIGEKGVSLSTFWRRLREYAAETSAGSIESVST